MANAAALELYQLYRRYDVSTIQITGFLPLNVPSMELLYANNCDLVQTCIGSKSCNIGVSINTFGDPCKGVTKSLAVEASCT